jgi:hypothetical protein
MSASPNENRSKRKWEYAHPILASPCQFIRRNFMGDTRKVIKIGSPHVRLTLSFWKIWDIEKEMEICSTHFSLTLSVHKERLYG